MTRRVFIVDTNVIVSGLIGPNPNSPPARILDAMLNGAFTYIMSTHLFSEYSSVLQRKTPARQHGLTDFEVDQLLNDIIDNATWDDPAINSIAPDYNDTHLWALLENQPQAQLITGDRLLIDNPPSSVTVLSPREFVDIVLT